MEPGASQEATSKAYEAKRARIVELATVAPHRKMLEEMLEAYARARAALARRAMAETAESPEPAETWSAGASAPPGTADGHMDPLGAELAFGEGQALLAEGKMAEAVERLQLAVDSRPDQAAYQAWLGWALWQAQGDGAADQVRERLGHALALDPDSMEAHALLGTFLCAIRAGAEARPHLERALTLRPEQPEVIDKLAGLYIDAGEADQAEKLYRRVIAALGDREPAVRAILWEKLGHLYEAKLGDPAAAALAFRSAAGITPG